MLVATLPETGERLEDLTHQSEGVKQATILIADDDIQSRKLLEVLLQADGYLTLSAANGKEALASIAKHAPDLILLDIMMPGLDGYQVAGALKANPVTSNIPIIMVTAHNDRSARLAALGAGAEEFLTKPVDRTELCLRVRNLLRLKEFGDFLKNHSVILEQQVLARTVDLQRFRAAMEISGDAILLVDRASMRYIDVNQTFCELVGRTRQEVIGMTPMELFSANRETLERDYDAIIADSNSSPTAIEGQYRHKDGSLIPIETRRRALLTDDGWIIVGTARDISVRKRVEETLRESEERFSSAFAHAPIGVALVLPDGRWLKVNKAICDLVGYSEAELLTRTFQDITYPEDLEIDLENVRRMIAGEIHSFEMEKRYVHARGHLVTVLLNVSLVRDGQGQPLYFISQIQDITERKLAEIRIKFLNRVYAMLSGINALIVRVADRDELFREACRIAVEVGQFRMSWIGIVDHNAMKIDPVASAGSKLEYTAFIRKQLSLAEGFPLTDSLTARAIGEKKVMFSNDTLNDPKVRFKNEHIENGTHSLAVLPLLVSHEAIGALILYAEEADFFNPAELNLLTELVGNIAFALDHIGKTEKLEYLAYYDALTGLANRRLFLERVGQYMRSATSGGHKLAVFLVDLERFKNINDSLGQKAGDALLRQVGEWLTLKAEGASFVARLGADHFALVLPEVKQETGVGRLVEKILAAFLEHPFQLDDTVFRIAAKVGVALFPNDGTDADALLKSAEAALKKAKARGERYLFYTQKMTDAVAGKLTLENQLRQALDKGEFVLHYQPKVSLASGKLTSAEALIRWNDPRTGLVPPGRFIPILEETGLIYDVGRWALRTAIENYLRWRATGLPAVRIAVNVSPLQLRNRGFIDEIKQAIAIDAHAAAGLELEMTEGLIMEDVKHNIASLQAIRAMGVTIAIDDFGTGFSSLSYLAKLPVDTLKIDRSFVIDMTAGPDGLALVSTIVKLAHSLKLKVVAEGVETEEQSRLLRLLACDEMQGFLFSKPVPADIFEARFLVPPPAGAHHPAVDSPAGR